MTNDPSTVLSLLNHKVFLKRAETQRVFDTDWNTRCCRIDRKHKVFSIRSQTQGVFETGWNTRCFRNERKHRVFSKRSQTQGVFETSWNTRCFWNTSFGGVHCLTGPRLPHRSSELFGSFGTTKTHSVWHLRVTSQTLPPSCEGFPRCRVETQGVFEA